MLALLPVLLGASLAKGPDINRDSYGVAHIRAGSTAEAFYQDGYAVAQDRLWQMEMSRRVARAQLAEVLGAQYVASDKEVLQFGYTDEELQTQLDHLSPALKEAVREYTRGVNDWIASAKSSGLPAGYMKAGFEPRPWTELDTAAISVRLLQQFGRGGAGEIRNMALLGYLQSRPATKARVLDVLNDFSWFNEPSAPTTVAPADDKVHTRPDFYAPDKATTAAHFALLPKMGLLELMQGIRVASHETSTRMAASLSAPFETGSYCVVVSPKKSATGHPLLLSGPQMGFRSPSIVHEISMVAPGLDVVGMDVPGVPGVLVGYTQNLAWGLTSGVTDTDDIFFYGTQGDNSYLYDGSPKDFTAIRRELHVKGGATQTITQLRTVDGPVVLNSKGAKTAFAKKTSYWMRELESLNLVADLWHVKTVEEADKGIQAATMSFNVFYATAGGDIGYRYAGLMPLRAHGVDPRFPTPGGTKYAWRGMVPADQMPHTSNPSGGFLANWNTKPATWWPNGDTPVWGKIFRASNLVDQLQKPRLSTQDLEMAAWSIARGDETWPYFRPYVEAALKDLSVSDPAAIEGFDGRLIDGSRQAATYLRFIDLLRNELFLETTGNFISPEYFQLVIQPSVLLNGLQGKTHIDYLHGRKVADVVHAALVKACAGSMANGEPVRFHADGITVSGQPPIPYSNRGTYIQLIESLGAGFFGRDVVTPGVAEAGPHSMDQVDLARAWLFKPMSRQ